MIALVGAMFVAMGSASAEAIGDCRSGLAELGIGDMCTVSVPDPAPTAINDDTALGKVSAIKTSTPTVATVSTDGTVTAIAAGSATITVRTYTPRVAANPNASPPVAGNAEKIEDKTYSIAVRKIAVTKVEFGSLSPSLGQDGTPDSVADLTDDMFVPDTDSIFAAGTDIHVRVTSAFVESTDNTSRNVTYTVSVPTTGLSISRLDPSNTATPVAGAATTQRKSSAADSAVEDDGMLTVKSRNGDFILVTDGAPEGEYTVTATADDGTNTSQKFTATLRIGDAGNTVASATLSLGLREGFLTPTATDDKAETGSDSAGGEVNLVLNVQNGIDNNANASDVDQIRIVAPFGNIAYLSGTTFTPVPDNTIPGSALNDGSVIVRVMSQDSKERAIEVHAIVLGRVSGVATTGKQTLTFTGSANAISIDDATKTLRDVNVEMDEDGNLMDDAIALVVNSTDKSGNTTSPPLGLGITIDDPDGNAVGADKIKATSPEQGSDGKWRITATNVSGNSASTALKTGEYTLKAKSGSIEDTAMFTVAGAVDTITVDVDEMSPTELGQGLTVTAMVVDGDGAAAADDTHVNFESSDDKIAKRVGTSGNVNTKDGATSATFVVTGPGLVVITASTGGKTDSVVVNSSAGMVEPEAMPEEEVSVGCLSNLSGFSTWSCGVESSASEIFGLVSARGVTAIHLHNGTAWVRYSVVDGAMVPGSSDFMVTENDILYISN